MKNISRHIGTIENLKRLPSSQFGNPRYQFMVGGFTVRTAVDSSHGYSIANYEGKRVEVTVGNHYGYTTLNSIKGVPCT